MNRRSVGALATAGLVTAGTLTYLLVAGPPTTGTEAQASGPGQVHTIALRGLEADQANGAGPKVMGLPAEDTKPFSLLGVSWDDAHTKLDGAVQVRTRAAATDAWSGWTSVEANSDDTPDIGSSDRQLRGATAPLWVGASNGVQVRVAGKSRALPRGLRVELVDPGNGHRRSGPRAAGNGTGGRMALAAAVSAETAGPDPSSSPGNVQPSSPSSSVAPAPPEPSAGPSTEPAPSSPAEPPAGSTPPTAPPPAPTSTAPRPTIVSRAQWGADEKLVTSPAEYAPGIKVVFTHHTAGTNAYTCSESPAIIRSMLLYHVKTNGWNDIGYNFLVDKCGTIFEGRAGGVDRPVIGAHTYGFNTNSTGVAVLGDFRTVVPTQATLSAVAKIAAWKLGLHGGDPTGKAVLTTPLDNGKFKAGSSVSFNTISGHLDGYATECPGTQLYNRLSAIRAEAKQWSTPATSIALSGISGATKVGTTYYTKGAVTLSWKPAAVSGYEVLVDGAVVARPNAQATSAPVTLAAGKHTVQLRATNINGTTVSSPGYAVTADATAPVFSSAAALTVRSGSVSTGGSIPVALGWKVTDNTLLQSLKATSPSAATFTPTTTSWSAYAKANTSTIWSLTAADAAGNTRVSSVTRTASLLHETSSVRTGTWKTTSNSSYLGGGKAYYSSAKGATASYTVTGRSVGLIAARAANFGAIYVYVDGVKVSTVDLRASSGQFRQIVWSKSWSTSAKHTIKIVVAGTTGRPTVVTDGIAYIK
jgi:N-acetylmuramoyl-L-alanine amidase-like protein